MSGTLRTLLALSAARKTTPEIVHFECRFFVFAPSWGATRIAGKSLDL
jgi:hypothetical protein